MKSATEVGRQGWEEWREGKLRSGCVVWKNDGDDYASGSHMSRACPFFPISPTTWFACAGPGDHMSSFSQCEMVIWQRRESPQPNFGVMGCGHLFWGDKVLQAHQKTLVQAAGQVGLGLFSSSAHVGSKTASYWPRTAPGEPDYTIRGHFTVMKNDDKCKESMSWV